MICVAGEGWVAAQDLPGDCVQTLGGGCTPVASVELVSADTWVYNFTVAEAHTYFVGHGQWLVHNQCARPISELPEAAFEGLGDLSPAKAREMQALVERVGAPAYVVGGHAKMVHHNNPPDIDLFIAKEHRAVWQEYINAGGWFPERVNWQVTMVDSLKEVGIIRGQPGVHEPFILFTPDRLPKYVR